MLSSGWSDWNSIKWNLKLQVKHQGNAQPHMLYVTIRPVQLSHWPPQNQRIFSLQWYDEENSSRSSHLRSRIEWMFGGLCLINVEFNRHNILKCLWPLITGQKEIFVSFSDCLIWLSVLSLLIISDLLLTYALGATELCTMPHIVVLDIYTSGYLTLYQLICWLFINQSVGYY